MKSARPTAMSSVDLNENSVGIVSHVSIFPMP